jgi:hypothetical protein
MPSIRRLSILWLLVAAFCLRAGSAMAQLDMPAVARLDQLTATPALAGELVYRGVVASTRAPAVPLFTYQRHVALAPAGVVATHITSDLAGHVVVVESAEMSPAYSLVRFEAINRQLGSSGSVAVTQGGRHLEFRRTANGRVATASEDVRDPVVSGPSLHGFILARWDELAGDKPITVRMVVLNAMETYGFDIRRLAAKNGRATVTITPSNLLVRLAIAPLQVEFDAVTRKLLRYEGRVPPMQLVDGNLRDLDAGVDYRMVAPAYR